MLQLTQSFLTRNRTATNPQTMPVKGIMLHSVGVPQPNAEVFIRNIDTPTASVSYHAIIEPGGRAFQLLPWTNRAWHAGGAANNGYIAVELTEPGTIKYTEGANFIDNDPEKTKAFVKDTYATAVELFADLCMQFGLNPLADGVIISHSEGHKRGIASNHADVEHLWSRFGLTMDQFRKDVAATISQGGSSPGSETKATLMRVHTQSSPLNVRVAPSIGAPVAGQLSKGELVTTTRSAGDWLYVKNDTLAGWATAQYLKDAVWQAIERLANQGVISAPEYWVTRYRDIAQLDWLLIKLSELTYKEETPLAGAEEAIQILHQQGVIKAPEYWRENHKRMPFLDTLLVRAASKA